MLAPARLVTARLELAPLVVADAASMVDVLADDRMYEFTGGRPPTLDELRERYERLVRGHAADGAELWFNWVVRQVTDAAPVGVLQATVVADGSAADVAWEIGVPWQARGFASEGAGAVVAWLAAADVRTIRALIHPDHHASARVARRAGFAPTADLEEGEVVWVAVRDASTSVATGQ